MRFFLSLFFCFIASLSSDVHTLKLCDHGCVRYFTDGVQINQIERLSKIDEIMYTCSYDYDEQGKLISECLTNVLGERFYHNNFDSVDEQTDRKERNTQLSTEYDSLGNLIRLENKMFAYDKQNRLIRVTTPKDIIEYEYDSTGNEFLEHLMDKQNTMFITALMSLRALMKQEM